MSKVRYDIKGQLLVLSPLHLGTGQVRQISTITGKEGANTSPEVAALLRDATGRPYLSGSTLKGLLRRIAEGAMEQELVDALFGALKGEDGGTKGALVVAGASLDRPGETADAPYVQGAAQELGGGVFVAARTAVDPASGTVDDGKLFFAEMVAPGAQFGLRLSIERRGTDSLADASSILDKTLRLLKSLAQDEGWSIGKGQADGFGRVRLDPRSVKIERRALNSSGVFASSSVSGVWEKAPAMVRRKPPRSVDLHLSCEGPFAIVDASRGSSSGKGKAEGAAQLAAQRIRQVPLVLGSSLSGVLRARANWIEKLQLLRGQRSQADSCLRLFGTQEARALVSISRLDVVKADRWQVTSVKLDRFSGGPVDNALFTTDCFINTELSLRLVLEDRGGVMSPSEDDVALFDALVADVSENGIELGHATNRGFGWFKVREAQHVH
ncbi:RAMP superfamily CRISPR-associated protein [Xanthobacter sp. AM11]|uniref:RAMP superfamily CRISPR-associated protein n=1 Tax=Xanthobacter sp. AM11 TaxID=3380643 RepID=UPI0039BF43D2